MATDGEDVLTRGLEAIGAHQRAATRTAQHNPELHEAVRQLLAEGLRRVYAAHRLAAERMPEQLAHATAPELRAALERGVKENDAQIERAERTFLYIDFSAERTPDHAMQALVDDARATVEGAKPGVARDQALIAAAQLAAHYYLAGYGTLRSYARTVGNEDAAKLLGESLDEIARADEAFTTLALHLIASSPAQATGPSA